MSSTSHASPVLQGALVGALLLGIGYAVGWNAGRAVSEAQGPSSQSTASGLARTPAHVEAFDGTRHAEPMAAIPERLALPEGRRPTPVDGEAHTGASVPGSEEALSSGPDPSEAETLREALEASRRREAHLLDRALQAEMAARSMERSVTNATTPSSPGSVNPASEDVARAAARAASELLSGGGTVTLPDPPEGSLVGPPEVDVVETTAKIDLASVRDLLLALGPWPFTGKLPVWPPGSRDEPVEEEPAPPKNMTPAEIETFQRLFQQQLALEGYTELELNRVEDVDEYGLHEPLFRVIDGRGGTRSVIRARRARFRGHARLRTITMELLDGYEQPMGGEPEHFYQGRRVVTWADVRYAEWVELLASAGGVLEEEDDVQTDTKWSISAVMDDLEQLLDRSRGERACRVRRLQGVSTEGELIGLEIHQYRDRARTQLEVIYEAGRARVTYDDRYDRIEFELLEGFQRRGDQRIPFFEGRCRVYVPLTVEALGEAWERLPHPSTTPGEPAGNDEKGA